MTGKYCYSSYPFETAIYKVKFKIKLRGYTRVFYVFSNNPDPKKIIDYTIFHSKQFYKKNIKRITTEIYDFNKST